MNDVIDTAGFRANVAIVLLRSTNEVFIGRRAGGRGWQFPQGGLRQDEQPEEAVYRELYEEIGIQATEVDLLGSTPDWLHYRLPQRYLRPEQQPLCIGQKQRWFLFRAKSDTLRFDFETTAEPEFDRWRWVNYWQPARMVIGFKRPVYREALKRLSSLAF
jgi:putative (di)nucleoside polyphosphate hydrolase